MVKHRNLYGVFCILYAVFFSEIIFKYLKLEQNLLNFIIVYIFIPLLIPLVHFLIEKSAKERTT